MKEFTDYLLRRSEYLAAKKAQSDTQQREDAAWHGYYAAKVALQKSLGVVVDVYSGLDDDVLLAFARTAK